MSLVEIIKLLKNNKTNVNVNKSLVDGNLALKTVSTCYETPKIKKLIVKKSAPKVFMGCWQGCNEECEEDGC